jgi:predicted amidophosphoribosyltransferase
MQEIIGLFACITPVLLIVAMLAMASRRPGCPNCHFALSRDDAACPKCDHSPSHDKVASHTPGERRGRDE